MQELYTQLASRDRNPPQTFTEIRIYSCMEVRVLPVEPELLQATISAIKSNWIQKKMGYSSRIHLYKEPLCSFNKIEYMATTTLAQVLACFGPVCFTFNNTQFCEEPEYNHEPVYSRPLTADAIEVVVQICQNNYFVHENYRVQPNTRIGFFRDIAGRYGRNLHVRYHNTRISLAQFSKQSIVQHTVGKLLDHMKRLTITIDSIEGQDIGASSYLQVIEEGYPIDQQMFFILSVGSHLYAISRKCRLPQLKYVLSIAFGRQVQLIDGHGSRITSQFIKDNQVSLLLPETTSPFLTLPYAIKHCQIVGQFQAPKPYFVTVQESKIMRTLAVSSTGKELVAINTVSLPCPPSTHLDEDLFFTQGNTLIGYSITPSMIKLKYFSKSGRFLYMRVWPWHNSLYGDIEFVVVDLLCVRLKNQKKKVRVFFIHDPDKYLELMPCARFFPSRTGRNVYSDATGFFAISNEWCESVDVYQLGQKNRLLEIRHPKYRELSDVFFVHPHSKIVLNIANKELAVYDIQKGDLLYNVLCEKGMNSFMAFDQSIVCCSGTEIRVFQDGSHSQPQKEEKQKMTERKATMGWSDPIHIPEHCLIVLPSKKLLVRENELQFMAFRQVYMLQSLSI